MIIRSIKQRKDFFGKRIFLRVDLNVPMEDGEIVDDYKIISVLPDIRFLIRHKCKVIIASHLGDPGGERNEKYSLRPVYERLKIFFGDKVKFSEDCAGMKTGSDVAAMKGGDILLLENLRFHGGEEKNDVKFAARLAELADVYVNDAFASSHRRHASVAAIKKFLPSFAGGLLAEEVKNLDRILKPAKPLAIVLGGIKISTKLPILKKLSVKADFVLLGGAMANNFLAAAGYETGRLVLKKSDIGMAKDIMKKIYQKKDKKLFLPIDVIVSGNSGRARAKKINEIDKNDFILDIGPETIRLYSRIIRKAKTVIWNGPLGKFESARFRYGTVSIARVISSISRGSVFGVVGGGETVEAVKMAGMADYVDWISTGGGAMFAYLSGERMPGLEGIVKQ